MHKLLFYSKIFITTLFLSTLSICPAFAKEPVEQFSNSLRVSPLSEVIHLKSGKVYSGEIEASNSASSDHDLTYHATVMPFSFANELGSIDLGTVSDRTQIKDWVYIDNPEGVIPVNGTVKIHYTIIVPEGAPAGGQYCVIAVSAIDEQAPDDQLVSNVLEIATVIYATVDGNINSAGSIIRNYIPMISFRSPFNTGVTLDNTGNVHLTANIKVQIENVLDDAEEHPETTFTETLLPETKYVKNFTIDGLSSIGIYRITQTVIYNRQKDVNSRIVFIIPLWLCLLIVLIISALIIWLIIVIKTHISTNHYISQANNNFSIHKKHKM